VLQSTRARRRPLAGVARFLISGQVANTDPRNAPIPAVTAIAKALQNVTRRTPRITFAFPT